MIAKTSSNWCTAKLLEERSRFEIKKDTMEAVCGHRQLTGY